jgi:hypothetical protein
MAPKSAFSDRNRGSSVVRNRRLRKKRISFPEFSVCVSLACLGKSIIFERQTAPKNTCLRTGARAPRPAPLPCARDPAARCCADAGAAVRRHHNRDRDAGTDQSGRFQVVDGLRTRQFS